jgi:hypothetical protein
MFDDGSKLTLCKISILLLCIALKDRVCARSRGSVVDYSVRETMYYIGSMGATFERNDGSLIFVVFRLRRRGVFNVSTAGEQRRWMI